MPDYGPASIYETQLVPTIFEPLARILIERARPKPGEYVLDAACGTGVVARSVAPMVGPRTFAVATMLGERCDADLTTSWGTARARP
jgi:hypothetical protein